MITLLLIAYVIISLVIARQKYWDMEIDRERGNVNKCYMNGKKSLVYGFLFLPKYFIAVAVLMVIAKGLVESITWILWNMP